MLYQDVYLAKFKKLQLLKTIIRYFIETKR